MAIRSVIVGLGLLWWVVVTTGCSTTNIARDFALFETGRGAAATVYFFRPPTERRMGFADNAVAIEFNGQKMVDLDKGDYIMVRLVPREYTMTLRNMSEVGPTWQTKEMVRRYPIEFKAGQRYYLSIDAVDGEFRGIFFRPKQLDVHEAKRLAETLRSVGDVGAIEVGSAL
ncbi:MAG: hypothetical protein FD130_63 [Halothiobacillaceae bacterium]|nr:MAG: hypothetical protein FD130_63 [Halothiobacillaceae bacterium]